MHNGMVQTGSEKMAKSVGNIFLLHEATAQYGGPAVVNFLTSGHYRQPLVFGEKELEQAVARNERIRDFFRGAERVEGEPDARVAAARDAFIEALSDDFNTPRAMAALYELIGDANKAPLTGAHAVVEELLGIVGLESLAAPEEDAGEEAEGLLAEREHARAAKDFARADEIRDRLAELGFEVRDGAEGASLVRK
jgi:cysteinyl-tRNA synthetase